MPIRTELLIAASVVVLACGDSGVAPSGGAAPGGAGGMEASGGNAHNGGSANDGGANSGGGNGGSSVGGEGNGGAPPLTFLEVYPLEAQYPEGGIYDPGAHAFYVGSLGDGSIHKVAADTGEETVLFTESAPGTWWSLGMDVDVARRRLWVCAMDDSQDPRAGYVWIFDLDTGARVRNWPLSDAMPDASCTDVALTSDGRGFVGDREQGFLYEVGFDAGATLFTQSDELSAAVVGQNAEVILPNQTALLSLLYLPSGLARVDLGTGVVTPVAIDGTFSDLSFLAGADGMTLYQGDLFVAFTSKLIHLQPTLADWSQATSTDMDVTSGQTDIVATPNGLYLLNGQSVTFALGNDPDPFQLVKVVAP
ncbi:MAG: hypothetical protein U0271_19935 [Polyangiaceae bacterium]